jgi:DNA mismatch repair protein MutS2
MRLEEYWGVGPKTRALLVAELGVDAAIDAIEAGDVRALVDAGVPRGRATRILRRATGGSGMDVLATSDARDVYKELLSVAGSFALTARAADAIHVLTPLSDQDAMEERLADVEAARESWEALSDDERAAVVEAFDAYDAADGGEKASVEAAIALLSAGVVDDDGVFAPLANLNRDALADAARALGALQEGHVATGADDRLDALREQVAAVETLEANAASVVEAIRGDGARSAGGFQDAFVDHVCGETGVDATHVREAAPEGARDATDFVNEALRALSTDRREAVEEREREVRVDLQGAVADAREDVDRAVGAVDDVAFELSLARFAAAFDLTSPAFVTDAVAVEGARNLTLAAREAETSVQPIRYALGDHDLGTPGQERVSVLTGANSGGKTTLLETLCQVVLLAHMGLPVPAEHAAVGRFDSVVFHRRHASFNAGVLESTLRNVVPPLTAEGRTLMLVDEFEAITEPGSAAELLHGLVTLSVEKAALGTFVTHLADDLEPLPSTARVDGIFAEGLTPDLELEVDYQPRFGEVGRSTPEFIVSRLVANADDRAERAGFETLAEAVGREVVQRTLADARWTES